MNPFLIKHYKSPFYFCNREDEIEILMRNIENQSNTVFFSQRRIGKTALVKHLFYLLKSGDHSCIYLDIYATQSLKEFIDQLANSIYRTFPVEMSIGKRFWESIKLLRPVLSMNPMTGLPEMSLDISKPTQVERTVAQLLRFLESQKKPVLIAIDEFQQILEYPEKNVEAVLRTAIQPLQHVHFIFLGSNQKLMTHIFHDAKRPFYAETKNLVLQRIEKDKYNDFILKHFHKAGTKISKKTIDLILDITDRHTYYTQFLCHEIFSRSPKRVTADYVYKVLYQILSENEGVYYQYRNLLTSLQWKLLKALAKEEKTPKPFSQKFIKKYDLGAPTSVKRTLESLIDKELVYHQSMYEHSYFEVQDKFLMRWLQYKF